MNIIVIIYGFQAKKRYRDLYPDTAVSATGLCGYPQPDKITSRDCDKRTCR